MMEALVSNVPELGVLILESCHDFSDVVAPHLNLPAPTLHMAIPQALHHLAGGQAIRYGFRIWSDGCGSYFCASLSLTFRSRIF